MMIGFLFALAIISVFFGLVLATFKLFSVLVKKMISEEENVKNGTRKSQL